MRSRSSLSPSILYKKQCWTTIGPTDRLTVDEARKLARKIIVRVRQGLPGIEPPPTKPESFQAIAENWLRRYVRAKGLRSAADIEHTLRRHIFPLWGERDFISINRSDVARLLDHIEDNHGGRIADLVLSYIRSLTNWYAARSDTYISPVIRGMARHGLRKRERVLSDEELRLIWNAAAVNPGPFGGLVKLLLLTAQRLDKVATIEWGDIDANGVWHIRSEPREKGNAGALPLPPLALDVVRAQRRIAGNPFIFAGREPGQPIHPRGGKRKFDRACGVTGWVLHDLRRTARSLMSRAGVSSEHAERVLGHAIKGVEGVYDRHRYEAEKGRALDALAGLITRILEGNDGVIPFRREA